MKALLALLGCFACASTASADSFVEHDYILNCAGCHRLDGTGSATVPSLVAMRELVAKPGTREYWVQVPGAAQAPLSNERLAALLNWLVLRFTKAAPSPPYSAQEVARLRQDPLRDPLRRRKEILSGKVKR